MKCLVIGSQGQVGGELVKTLAPLGELVSWHRQQLDLTQGDRIYEAVRTLHPDVIVNAAAYTAVDRAESEPELAHQINGLAPKYLALAARDCEATLFHLSTDYVFDGTQGFPYVETDAPNPQSLYGQSKLAGETAIREVGGHYVIMRTAWVYGCQGTGNFVKTMLRLGAEREMLRVVNDQIGSPTWAYDIAAAMAAMVRRRDQLSSGIYHYTNSGVASWYDFAVAIFEEAVPLSFPIKLSTVVPIPTSEYPLPAPRPAYSVLSGVKLSQCLGSTPPHWRQSLRRMLVELSEQTP